MEDEHREEIGRLIVVGFTEGRLDSPNGHSVYWKLNINEWDDEEGDT